MSGPNMIPAAIAIGKRFPVFPTINGKPRCPHGVKDASEDPEQIKALWRSCPGANVSAAMGRASGFLGLDVDMKGGRDGIASLAALEAEHGPLPLTPRYWTPSGGLGILFKHPGVDFPNRFDFRPGLEIHSDGAAMTLPPSQKGGLPYTWIATPREVPFADVPAWLLAVAYPPLPAPRERKPVRADSFDRLARYVAKAVEEECAAVATMGPDTGRNRALFIAAAKIGEFVGADLLRRDMAEGELEEAAMACGLAAADGWRAVRATIKSGLDRGVARPREISR